MASAARAQRDLYLPETATVVKSEALTKLERFYEIRLDSGKQLGNKPGQFVMVSLPGIGEAPAGVSSCADKTDGFELVIRNVGRLTSALHQLKPGSKVGIRGPLGTSFPIERCKRKNLLFICAGMGFVPVRSPIQYVLNRRTDYGDVAILYGCKNPVERLFISELSAWAARKDITFLETVDRGDETWKGNVGVITTLLPKVKIDPAKTMVIACGPPVMYKFLLLDLFKIKVPKENIYLSLERRMKCGVGKCGHCQINSLYCCIDGPVFKYSDIAGFEEAI